MAAVAALAALVSIIAAILTTDALPRVAATLLLFFALALVAVSLWFRQWEIPLQLLSTVLLVVVAWWAEERVWWISVFALFSVLGTFSVALLRARKRSGDAEAKADQLAVQVDRRISELFRCRS